MSPVLCGWRAEVVLSLLVVAGPPVAFAPEECHSPSHVYHEHLSGLALWFLHLRASSSASCQVPRVLLTALSSLSTVSPTPTGESALLSRAHGV